ncbi:hypothetical protein PoB_005710900 [Plakobranchus ocellatus]|uniref:Uncharacterized protein n=1 Tax=Plakobranchus ocellatus TaxID=259542 RepID=A0AAV4CDB6_9GAST|nr:hypothetical protein PoB_005710900 [Plakobranchus ocellatus]
MVETSTPESKRIATADAARNVKASAKTNKQTKNLFVNKSSDSDMDLETVSMDKSSSDSELENDCVRLKEGSKFDEMTERVEEGSELEELRADEMTEKVEEGSELEELRADERTERVEEGS